MRTTLSVGLLMLLSLALWAFFFSGASLRLDEAQSLWQSGRPAGDILTIVAQDVHVPLYHTLLHYWRLTVGDSVFAARALSLVFYLISIPALYFLGKEAYGRRVGLFAALLFAISPFMNWYGAEVRMYTLFTLLAILNQYCYIRLMKGTARGHAGALYALTALFGIFTHYFFALILGAQALYFILRRSVFPRGSAKTFFVSWLFVAVCFAPWVVFVVSQGQSQNASPALSAPTTVNLFNTLAQFVFGFQDDHLSTILVSLWPLTVLLALLALRKNRGTEPVSEYLLLTVVLGIVGAFVASILIAPVFVSRYLIFTVPALYLLLASFISLYPPRAATLARGALVVLMLSMLALEVWNPSTPLKENYREVSERLAQQAKAQDVIILSAPFTIYPIEYYYRGPAPVATLPLWDRYAYGPIPAFDESKLPEEVQTETKDHQYAWLLLSYDQGYEETIQQYFDNNYEKVSEETFSPGLHLYQYKIRYDTPLANER